MKRTTLSGGLILIVLFACWILAMADTVNQLAAFMTSDDALVQGNAARWLIWAAWGWLVLNVVVTLAMGCKLTPRTFTVASFKLPMHWLLALSSWAVGLLVALATGDTHAGMMLAWAGVPWLALLVWQSLRCVEG